MTDLAPGVQVGEILAGKYEVERVLGAGGMGVVVAARHLKLDERVALKFMLPVAMKDADAVSRFEREARAAVKIKSAHVATISDVGVLENGAPYIVMEYLEGEDLAASLRRGPLPVAQAADSVIEACDALFEAHALGIVHRDLKPANLFSARRRDGSTIIKILDFGISKASVGQLDMTRSQSLLGTPLYMSPEQMQQPKTVDARTDIWSMGVVLYELLAGTVPFLGETLPELILAIVSQPAPSIGRLRPDIPPALDQVVARCLTKNRDDRFSSIGELALALAPFATPHSRASVDRIARLLSPPMDDQSRAGSARPAAQTRRIDTARPNTPFPPPTPATALLPPISSAPPARAAVTGSAWGDSTSGQPPKKTGPNLAAVIAGGVLVVALAGGGLYATRKRTTPEPLTAAVQASVSAPPPAVSSAPPPLTSSAPQPATPDVAEPVRPSPPSPTAPAIVPTAAALPKPPSTVTKPAAAASASAPASSANCATPYTFGPDGKKNFKRECL